MLSFRQTPETFSVKEILFFEPEGVGEHCFGFFEKSGITTADLKRAVSAKVGVSLDQVKHAGLKDRQALAYQWLSWPSSQTPEPFAGEGFRLLKVVHHPHSLSIGHVRENQFSIQLSGALDASMLVGPFLNLFGAQRNMPSLESIPKLFIERRKWTPFLVSQVQASLFNLFVLWRWQRNQAQPEPGELWRHVHSKKTFTDEDFETLSHRFQAGEISPTGPVYGTKALWPKHTLERDFLRMHGMDENVFSPWRKKGRGARRPIWVWPGDLTVQAQQGNTLLQFSLPSGSYATVFLLWFLDRQRLLVGDPPNFADGHVLAP